MLSVVLDLQETLLKTLPNIRAIVSTPMAEGSWTVQAFSSNPTSIIAACGLHRFNNVATLHFRAPLQPTPLTSNISFKFESIKEDQTRKSILTQYEDATRKIKKPSSAGMDEWLLKCTPDNLLYVNNTPEEPETIQWTQRNPQAFTANLSGNLLLKVFQDSRVPAMTNWQWEVITKNDAHQIDRTPYENANQAQKAAAQTALRKGWINRKPPVYRVRVPPQIFTTQTTTGMFVLASPLIPMSEFFSPKRDTPTPEELPALTELTQEVPVVVNSFGFIVPQRRIPGRPLLGWVKCVQPPAPQKQKGKALWVRLDTTDKAPESVVTVSDCPFYITTTIETQRGMPEASVVLDIGVTLHVLQKDPPEERAVEEWMILADGKSLSYKKLNIQKTRLTSFTQAMLETEKIIARFTEIIRDP
jgi:hypothetical protein